jgi:hypothetical protein
MDFSIRPRKPGDDLPNPHEYTKDEWKEIALKVKPDLTDDEYDAMWNDFQSRKAEGQFLHPPH